MGTVLKSRLSPCNGLRRKIAEAGKSLRRLRNFPVGDRDGMGSRETERGEFTVSGANKGESK
jgi:hypothetical protein